MKLNINTHYQYVPVLTKPAIDTGTAVGTAVPIVVYLVPDIYGVQYDNISYKNSNYGTAVFERRRTQHVIYERIFYEAMQKAINCVLRVLSSH